MFKKYLYSLIVLACAGCILFSCSEETSPAREADAFTSVFDDNRFNAAVDILSWVNCKLILRPIPVPLFTC
jgi:hypothetical protein